MKLFKGGFTLIEVALFLAITGMLFIGVTVGVQNSIYQQRYNDSVQNFIEYLRTLYSETMNVQGTGDGRSEKAVLGRLAIFTASDENDNSITTYSVVGDANSEINTGNVLDALDNAHANIYVKEKDGAKLAGMEESYTPKWASQIQSPCKSDTDCNESYAPIGMVLLIIRHPYTGTVYTYSSKNADKEKVNEWLREMEQAAKNNNTEKKFFGKKIQAEYGLQKFSTDSIDFCINPEGDSRSAMRTDVRINANARNTSAIGTIPEEEGVCRPRS